MIARKVEYKDGQLEQGGIGRNSPCVIILTTKEAKEGSSVSGLGLCFHNAKGLGPLLP